MPTITQLTVAAARRRGVKILTRDQWGSQAEDIYQKRRELTAAGHWGEFVLRPSLLFQHMTVTDDDGPLTGDFAADMREVEHVGVQRFGSGLSYNFVVDMTTGMAGVGMPLDAKGTHTVNDKHVTGLPYDLNRYARAVAVLGLPHYRLSAAAELTIVRLHLAMIDTDALRPGYKYHPHSLVAAKDCPCDPTRNRMDEIRREVRRTRRREARK